MKLFFVLFFAFSLFCCDDIQKKKSELRQDEIVLPEGSVPIQYDGETILYQYCSNDSVKFYVIVDSGIESFLIDRGFIADNNVGITDAEDPMWIIVTMRSAFKPDGYRVYRTKVDRNSSPLLANKMMSVWAVILDYNNQYLYLKKL